MERRTRVEVAADILRVAREGARKTRIVYGANLNFTVIVPYLSDLTARGKLVQKGPYFHTTPKGEEHIKLVEALTR